MLFAVAQIHQEPSGLPEKIIILLRQWQNDLVNIEQRIIEEEIDLQFLINALKKISDFLQKTLEHDLQKYAVFEYDFVTYLQEAKDSLFVVKCNPDLGKISIAKQLNKGHNALVRAIHALDKTLENA